MGQIMFYFLILALISGAGIFVLCMGDVLMTALYRYSKRFRRFIDQLPLWND